MKFDFPYNVAREEVRGRLEALGEYLHNRHGIRVDWVDDSTARFSGKYLVVKIDGEMKIADSAVEVRGEDPGMLWRKKAVEYMRDKLSVYLDPKTPLDKLPRSRP